MTFHSYIPSWLGSLHGDILLVCSNKGFKAEIISCVEVLGVFYYVNKTKTEIVNLSSDALLDQLRQANKPGNAIFVGTTFKSRTQSQIGNAAGKPSKGMSCLQPRKCSLTISAKSSRGCIKRTGSAIPLKI
jgi:hypothetical protein